MLRSVVSCILLCSSVPALAADLPRVGVVGIHQASLDPAEQERAVERLVAAIEATGRFDALAPAELATALAGRESIVLEEGLLSTGRQQLASGKNAYNQASPDDAVPYLEAAIESLRAAFSGTNDATDLWEAQVWLGTSQLQRDPPQEAAARAALAQAIALSPTRPLNPALYPPNVIEVFEMIRSDLESRVVPLSVTTDSPANVWIDGVDKGPSPATVPGIVPGVHHVLARGSATQGYVQLDVAPAAAVDGGAPPAGAQVVAVPLGPMRLGEGAASATGRSNEIAATYLSLGHRADGLDYLLLVGVSDSLLQIQLLSVGTSTFSKPIELPYSEDADDEAAQAVPLLLNGIDANGTFTSTVPAPGPVDIGANSELAMLLTNRILPTPVSGVPVEPIPPPEKKSKVGVVLGIVGGIVVASAAGAGTWLVLQGEDEPEQGAIVIQF